MYGWANISLFIILPITFGFIATKTISEKLKVQPFVEKTVSVVIKFSSYIAILITFGIFFSLVFEAINFFRYVNFMDFFLTPLGTQTEHLLLMLLRALTRRP
jgi:phosphate transport system permease protein